MRDRPILLCAALLCLAAPVPAAPGAVAPDSVRSLIRSGQHAAADSEARRLLAETEAAHGRDSIESARVLDLLVEALRRGGPGAEARLLAERAVAIKEKALGPAHPELAQSLMYLSILLRDAGDFERARPLSERALAIREQALGRDHSEVAASLNSLAVLLKTTGDFEGARPLLERALAIRERTFGSEHPNVALALNSLAVVLRHLGEYDEARALLERALAIDEQALGPDHPEVATTLVNLGNILKATGDYVRARPVVERALAIDEKVHGPEHPMVAESLNNLANLLRLTGDRAGARALHERALAIREQAFGPEHPEVAQSLSNLALLLHDTGDDAGARAHGERALAIREKTLGPDHPEVARSLSNLALLRARTADLDGAIALLTRARDIFERALGPQHPDVAQSLAELAELDLAAGEPERALDRALRAEEIGREHLRLTARTLPERQALGYAAVRAAGLDLALSAAAGARATPGARRRAWDALIRGRALVLDEMAARHRTIIETSDPEIVRLAGEWRAARAQLGNLVVRGPAQEPAERHLRRLDEARQDEEAAERALAEKSAAHRAEFERSRFGFEDVAGALPPGSALVAYARFLRHAPAANRLATAVPSYLALVQRDGAADPAAIPLGDAGEIDALVSRWRDESGREAVGRSLPAAEIEAAQRAAGEALRAKVWDPVARQLGAAERVFVVPDGALHLVDLAALPAASPSGDGYLIETGPLLHTLVAERDLVPPAAPDPEGNGMLALGDPDFGAAGAGGSTGAGAAAGPGPGSAALEAALALSNPFRGGRPQCGSFASMRFGPLRAAARETEEVAAIWKTRRGDPGVVLLGGDASESAFKTRAPGRRVLHLATHAFFLDGDCQPASAGSRGGDDLAAPAAGGPGENPLLLSGMALAGANRRAEAGPDDEDGILTAEEIAALDLRGVEWAVLSACDTGAGRVTAGEGVFGLRRAFQVAGARTVIMSLWPVDDRATRDWMRALYRGRFERGLPTAEAVRAAGRALLAARREKRLSTHPHYWAGFIAAGDWR